MTFFVSIGLSVIELLGFWPTVIFMIDANPFLCYVPSLTLLPVFLSLSFSLLATSFPTQLSSAVFCVKSVNAQWHSSLNKLILSNQHLPNFGRIHTTLVANISTLAYWYSSSITKKNVFKIELLTIRKFWSKFTHFLQASLFHKCKYFFMAAKMEQLINKIE